MKPLETPVAFIIFNRPDTTGRVFNEIRKARPKKLFVISDGPRNEKEKALVEETRKIIGRVDWDCEVQKNYSETNLGCKKRVSSGLDWFFEHVEEGIILEDDCLPAGSFFQYCEELLETYRDYEKVMMITGDNFQHEIRRGSGSYYFSRHSHIWGWATWKRAWKYYDVAMRTYPEFRRNGDIRRIWSDSTVAQYWIGIFDKMYNNKIDTWDFPWVYAIWRNGGMSIIPNVNLVSNIGFDERATHTKTESTKVSGLPIQEMVFPLAHPQGEAIDTEADEFTNQHIFNMNRHAPGKTLLQKIWTASPQSVSKKIRGVLRSRGVAHSTVVTVEGGYAKGVKLVMPTPVSGPYAAVVQGTYEDFTLRELQERTSLEGKVIWDVGAHVGYHSFSFAQLVGQKGKVVAFEPNPQNLLVFKKNLALNPSLAERIMLQECALSDTNGTLSFNASENAGDAATLGGYLSAVTPPLSNASYKNFSEIRVNAATIDTLTSEKKVPPPDILKIDVEGAEFAVLQGGSEYIKKHQPILIVEIHSIPMMFYVGKFLSEHNYTFQLINEDGDLFTKNICATPL